ncbi:MAG: hypothetical protein KKB31_03115 [Nanoarchaeota archaeon]|nr:hypothetical protein [Nanoarchaeota archaeon]
MRGIYLIFIFILACVPLTLAITGEVITGEATSVPTNVSIFVLPGPPVILIRSPENKTYSSQDVLVNYSVRNNFTHVGYNIDGGNNIFLSNLTDDSFSLNLPWGFHILYMFANSSLGNFSKNVSFTLEEEIVIPSSSSSSSSGSSSGGSSGGSVSTTKFEFSEEILEVSFLQGQSKKESFTITNTGTRDVSLELEIEGLENFALLNQNTLELPKGESKTISVNFFSLSTAPSGLYFGKLIARGNGVEESLLLIVDVKQREALFDVNVEVLPNYKTVPPGKKMSVTIDMINIGLSGTAVDVELMVYLVNLDRETILEASKETLAVKEELSITRKIQLPQDIEYGTYLVVADLIYTNITASSYDSFEVGERGPFYFISYIGRELFSNPYMIILLLIVILLIMMVIIVLKHYRVFSKSLIIKSKRRKKKEKLQKIPKSAEGWAR